MRVIKKNPARIVWLVFVSSLGFVSYFIFLLLSSIYLPFDSFPILLILLISFAIAFATDADSS